jgi:hypothetical protein
MKLVAVTAVTAAVLAFALPRTPPVLAQASDIGAASRPFPLEGGPPAGSDNHGQSSGEQSEGTERSRDISSEKSQTRVGKAGESPLRGRRAAIHRHGRHASLYHPRHYFWNHRRGRRVVALNEPSSV